MNTDTPRTDARVRRMIDNDHSPEGLEHWARDLERELNAANERIRRLENIIHTAEIQFFQDGSDGRTAAGMLTILNEAKSSP